MALTIIDLNEWLADLDPIERLSFTRLVWEDDAKERIEGLPESTYKEMAHLAYKQRQVDVQEIEFKRFKRQVIRENSRLQREI